MKTIPIIDQNNSSSSKPTINSSSIVKGNDHQMFLVSNLLNGNESYTQWKFSIQLAHGAKKKKIFIDGTLKKPESEGFELDEWISNECMVRSWLLSTISKEIVRAFIFASITR